MMHPTEEIMKKMMDAIEQSKEYMMKGAHHWKKESDKLKMNNLRINQLFSLKSAFNSVASSGFIFPPSINLTCLLLNAPSNNFFSSSVSGDHLWNWSWFAIWIKRHKCIIGFIAFVFVLMNCIFSPHFQMHFHGSIKGP